MSFKTRQTHALESCLSFFPFFLVCCVFISCFFFFCICSVLPSFLFSFSLFFRSIFFFVFFLFFVYLIACFSLFVCLLFVVSCSSHLPICPFLVNSSSCSCLRIFYLFLCFIFSPYTCFNLLSCFIFFRYTLHIHSLLNHSIFIPCICLRVRSRERKCPASRRVRAAQTNAL